MSKAKDTPETATETISKMNETASHVDSRGRRITVTRLNALSFYRLTKVMGANSNNAASMDLATLASSVRKIDGMDIAPPANEREVEFLIQQLDFDGLAAVGEALQKFNVADDGGVEAAKN